MRSIHAVVLSITFLASCAGDPFEATYVHNTDAGSAQDVQPQSDAGPADTLSFAETSITDATIPDGQDVAVVSDGASLPDVTGDVSVCPDVGTDASADAKAECISDVGVDVVVADVHEASQDTGSVDGAIDVQEAQAEAAKPDCLTTGVRVRWQVGSDRTIVQANGSLGATNALPQGTCTAVDDRDPLPNVFECCLSTDPVGSGIPVSLDFVDANKKHACDQYGCGNLNVYNVWANGVPCSLAVTYLPGCYESGCPWVIRCTTP
jgi:hypothetical protein